MALCRGFLERSQSAPDLSLHPWAIMERGQEWDRATKALYTTREDRVAGAVRRARDNKKKERVRAWKQEKSVRLAAGKRARNS
jgi:hypothetical protein